LNDVLEAVSVTPDKRPITGYMATWAGPIGWGHGWQCDNASHKPITRSSATAEKQRQNAFSGQRFLNQNVWMSEIVEPLRFRGVLCIARSVSQPR